MLLAGDAQSLINPLTGEGIFYAVLSGGLAGAAAVSGAAAGQAYRRALLNLSTSQLEQVLYFAKYVVTDPMDALRDGRPLRAGDAARGGLGLGERRRGGVRAAVTVRRVRHQGVPSRE